MNLGNFAFVDAFSLFLPGKLRSFSSPRVPRRGFFLLAATIFHALSV